jgi:hypothetical protein
MKEAAGSSEILLFAYRVGQMIIWNPVKEPDQGVWLQLSNWVKSAVGAQTTKGIFDRIHKKHDGIHKELDRIHNRKWDF